MSLKKTFLAFDKFELFIVIVSALAGVAFLVLPESSILSWFTTDDAFYYFVTAKNISLGLGSTFDGIALTNGYHPLWMILCIPIFALSRVSLLLPLRLVIVLQYGLAAISGIMLYRLVRKHVSTRAAYLTVFPWMFLPAIHSSIMLGGVESTLNSLMIIAVLAGIDWVSETNLTGPDQNRRSLVLGIISGLAILARLDNIFFVAFVGLWILLKLVTSLLRQHLPSKESLLSLQSLVYFAAPIILAFGIYLAWNQYSFDSIMPISGAVKRWWGVISGDPYGTPPGSLRQLYLESFASTNRNLVPFWLPYSFGQSIAEPLNRTLTAIGLPPLAKTIWILAGLGLVSFLDFPLTIHAIDGLSIVPLLLGAITQIGYYKLGGSVASRSWYWVQENLLFVLFLGVVAGVLLQLLQGCRAGKILADIVVAVSLIAIMFFYISYFRRNFLLPGTEKPDYLHNAEFLEQNTEEGAIIGIIASGSTSYFTQDRTIVNLDGLINGYDYFNALKNDEAADYLWNIGTDYIFGSREWLLEFPPYASNFEGKIVPLERADADKSSMILWRLQE